MQHHISHETKDFLNKQVYYYTIICSYIKNIVNILSRPLSHQEIFGCTNVYFH